MPKNNEKNRKTFAGVEIEYLGGIENVEKGESITGSCTLFTAQDTTGKKVRIVVDLGSHQQGFRSGDLNGELDRRIVEADYLIVTHAHIDHIGRLPMLQKAGFKGKIFMSHDTKLLAQQSLIDSARVLQKEYEESERRVKQRRTELQDTLRYINAKKKKEKGNLESGDRVSLDEKIESLEKRYGVPKLQENIGFLESKGISSNKGVEDILKKQQEPLYSEQDVKDFFQNQKIYTLEPGQFTHLPTSDHNGAKDIKDAAQIQAIILRFLGAGHITGSVQAEISIRTTQIVSDAKGKQRTVDDQRYLFSGDLGRIDLGNLAGKVEMPKRSYEYAQMESTYAGRQNHKEREEAIQDLFSALLKAKGNVIIPTFSIQRTQDLGLLLLRYYDEIVYPRVKELQEELKKLQTSSFGTLDGFRDKTSRIKQIEEELQRLQFKVYFDSNLGKQATSILSKDSQSPYYALSEGAQLEKYGEVLLHFIDPTICKMLSRGKIVDIGNQRHGEESKKIFVSSGGMCEGGPVINHLKNTVADPNATILFTGYAPPSSLGGRLRTDTEVLIDGDMFQVKAHIVSLDGFSGHADNGALETWASGFRTRILALTHGGEGRKTLRDTLAPQKGREIKIPQIGMKFRLPFISRNKKEYSPEFGEQGVIHESKKQKSRTQQIYPIIGGIDGILKRYNENLQKAQSNSDLDFRIENVVPYVLLIENEDFYGIIPETDKEIYELIVLIGQYFKEKIDTYKEILSFDSVEAMILALKNDVHLFSDFSAWGVEKQNESEKQQGKSDNPMLRKIILTVEEQEHMLLQSEFKALVSQFQDGNFSDMNIEGKEKKIYKALITSFFRGTNFGQKIIDFYSSNSARNFSNTKANVVGFFTQRLKDKENIRSLRKEKDSLETIEEALTFLCNTGLDPALYDSPNTLRTNIIEQKQIIFSFLEQNPIEGKFDIQEFKKVFSVFETTSLEKTEVHMLIKFISFFSLVSQHLGACITRKREELSEQQSEQISNVMQTVRDFVSSLEGLEKEKDEFKKMFLGFLSKGLLSDETKNQKHEYEQSISYLTGRYYRKLSIQERKSLHIKLKELILVLQSKKSQLESELVSCSSKVTSEKDKCQVRHYPYKKAEIESRVNKLSQIILLFQKYLDSVSQKTEKQTQLGIYRSQRDALLQNKEKNEEEKERSTLGAKLNSFMNTLLGSASSDLASQILSHLEKYKTFLDISDLQKRIQHSIVEIEKFISTQKNQDFNEIAEILGRLKLMDISENFGVQEKIQESIDIIKTLESSKTNTKNPDLIVRVLELLSFLHSFGIFGEQQESINDYIGKLQKLIVSDEQKASITQARNKISSLQNEGNLLAKNRELRQKYQDLAAHFVHFKSLSESQNSQKINKFREGFTGFKKQLGNYEIDKIGIISANIARLSSTQIRKNPAERNKIYAEIRNVFLSLEIPRLEDTTYMSQFSELKDYLRTLDSTLNIPFSHFLDEIKNSDSLQENKEKLKKVLIQFDIIEGFFLQDTTLQNITALRGILLQVKSSLNFSENIQRIIHISEKKSHAWKKSLKTLLAQIKSIDFPENTQLENVVRTLNSLLEEKDSSNISKEFRKISRFLQKIIVSFEVQQSSLSPQFLEVFSKLKNYIPDERYISLSESLSNWESLGTDTKKDVFQIIGDIRTHMQNENSESDSAFLNKELVQIERQQKLSKDIDLSETLNEYNSFYDSSLVLLNDLREIFNDRKERGKKVSLLKERFSTQSEIFSKLGRENEFLEVYTCLETCANNKTTSIDGEKNIDAIILDLQSKHQSRILYISGRKGEENLLQERKQEILTQLQTIDTQSEGLKIVHEMEESLLYERNKLEKIENTQKVCENIRASISSVENTIPSGKSKAVFGSLEKMILSLRELSSEFERKYTGLNILESLRSRLSHGGLNNKAIRKDVVAEWERFKESIKSPNEREIESLNKKIGNIQRELGEISVPLGIKDINELQKEGLPELSHSKSFEYIGVLRKLVLGQSVTPDEKKIRKSKERIQGFIQKIIGTKSEFETRIGNLEKKLQDFEKFPEIARLRNIFGGVFENIFPEEYLKTQGVDLLDRLVFEFLQKDFSTQEEILPFVTQFIIGNVGFENFKPGLFDEDKRKILKNLDNVIYSIHVSYVLPESQEDILNTDKYTLQGIIRDFREKLAYLKELIIQLGSVG